MKIAQAVVEMSSSHEYSSESEVKFASEDSFRTVFDQVSVANAPPGSKKEEGQLLLMLENLIARMLELITGKRDSQVTDLRELLKTKSGSSSGTAPAPTRPRQQVEIEWKSVMTERIHEQESTQFVSTGRIKTADGCSMDFKLDLAMGRDYACERKITDIKKVVMRDPLVINFDGKAADLSGKRFAFDLDADGKTESIAGLGSCSGYLAIDRNSDGCINDGNELFGTRSGNGFADLAKLDSDGNHWLDENDEAYDSLRIWRQNAAGENNLTSLRDAGVGALYLGSTETSFELTDEENTLLAHVRASGIYLTEKGSVGSLQQIDLAV